MNKKKIRWGIMGCGHIAHKFAQDLALNENGELYACASRDMDKSKAFANQYKAEQYFDRYEALANSTDIDVIYIATPHSYHFQNTMLCLDKNKAVLCEKPLAVNANQVNAMIEKAKSKNLLLMEAMWTAFLPNIVEVRKQVNTGLIGDIRHIKADFGFRVPFDQAHRLFNPALAGGTLLDIGIYPIFISLLLLGKPEKIAAFATLSGEGTDTECSMLLHYTNGATSSLYSTINTNTDTCCEIYGTAGKITILSRFHEQDHFFVKMNNGISNTHYCPKNGFGYFHEIEHIHACLQEGYPESPVMDFKTSVALIEIMDEIRSQIHVRYPFE